MMQLVPPPIVCSQPALIIIRTPMRSKAASRAMRMRRVAIRHAQQQSCEISSLLQPLNLQKSVISLFDELSDESYRRSNQWNPDAIELNPLANILAQTLVMSTAEEPIEISEDAFDSSVALNDANAEPSLDLIEGSSIQDASIIPIIEDGPYKAWNPVERGGTYANNAKELYIFCQRLENYLKRDEKMREIEYYTDVLHEVQETLNWTCAHCEGTREVYRHRQERLGRIMDQMMCFSLITALGASKCDRTLDHLQDFTASSSLCHLCS